MRRLPRPLALVGVLAALAVVVAGAATAREATSGGAAAVPKRPTYYPDVRPIVQGRCVMCHRPGGIGPFSLRTYRDAFLHRQEIARMVAARLMPPWRPEPGHRRYRFDFSLTGVQIKTITRWVAQGARRGNARRPGRGLPPLEWPTLSRVDANLAMPAPYKPSGVDDYRCFLLPWTPDRVRFVTGSGVRPGRPSQAHHASVLIVAPTLVETVEKLDSASDGEGFACGGGATSGAADPGLQFLGGWTPGGGPGINLPQGTGIRMVPGARILLQMHYHLGHAGHRALADQTRVFLRLADTARPSAWLMVTDTRWLLSGDRFRIPPNRKSIVYRFTGDPEKLAPFSTGDVDLSRGFLVHAASLHMHLLGTGGRLAVRRPGGRSDVLLSIRHWDFRWQGGYFFREPETFNADDELTLECRWDNTAANQPVVNGVRRKPRLITWGEGTLDEMCVGYLFVSTR